MKPLATLWSERSHRNIFWITAIANKIQKFYIVTTKSVFQVVSLGPFLTATGFGLNPVHFKQLFQTCIISGQVQRIGSKIEIGTGDL